MWQTVIHKTVHDVFKNFKMTKSKYNDVILNDYSSANSLYIQKAHEIKFVQMKIGDVWQRVIGQVDGLYDLRVGHQSGLDIMSDDNFTNGKFIMELKNSHNTDNSSSRKYNMKKLAEFGRENNDYSLIYAIINPQNGFECGEDYVIHYDEKTNIRFLTGRKLLNFIFEDDADSVLLSIKKSINELLLDSNCPSIS
jgi:hypothetical protein